MKMKIFANLILLTVLCIHITPISSTYAISGSVLTDLTETTPGAFGVGWTLSSYVSSPTKTSFCDGLLLLGGYNVLGGSSGASFTASYTGIPTPHNRLTFSITFWILDSWTNGDRFDLVFDLVTLTGWSFPATSASGNLCGVSTAGDISGVTIAGQVAHSATTLTFKVISQLSSASSTKSFGFRDITFTFDHVTTPPAINNTMCAITPIQMPTTPAATAVNTCSCLSTQYEYPTHTGNCYACHADCLSCTLSASTSCTACQPGKYLYGTQCQPCDTSCATCSTGGSNNCTSCNTGSYLVQNQTCVTSAICSYPLIQVAANGTISPAECTSPCSSASDFIYWDQSCASTCPAMLQQDNIGGLKLCKYPCLTSEYLYWDGTCQSSCGFPLKIIVQKQRNYCSFPCSSTQYLLWNGSCISTCPFYFVEVIKNSLRYCNMRCPVGQYYTQWDGNCVTSCAFPFKTEDYYCGLPCNDPFAYYYPHNRTCLEDCDTPFQIQTTEIFEQCVYPELDSFMAKVFLLAPYEDNMPTLVVLVRIMQYVRYLNISMPPRLERLALSKGLNIMSLNYGFNMPSSISEGFTVNPIISVFENQQLHSQFLVNFWKDLVCIVGIFILAILSYISELFYNRTDLKTLETIFGAFKAITLWNFLIIFFATSIDDIILFSSIEFMSFYYSMNNVLDYVSFVSSIIGLCLVVILVIFALYILIKRAPTIKTVDAFAQAAAGFTDQYRSCSVLFLGFNAKTVFGKFFFLIYMARLGLPMVFAMSLISEPVINVFLQVMLSVGILSCVIYFKPLKSQFNHFQLVLFEAIVLMMNVMMFLITVLKFYNIGSWETSVIIGDIVIAGNSITNLLAILFAIFKTASEISYVSKLIKAKTFQEKLSFLIQLLVIPMQQGRMGFECIFGVYSLYSAPTELGFDAEKTEKSKNKKTPIVHNEEPGPNELPRLANKQVRAKDFDGSELKNRLASIGGNKRGYIEADLPYQMNPLSLATNISKPPAGLDQLNSLRGPTQALSKRENSIELPKISMTDSSLAPLANRGDLSILNNTSYDFGDSTLYDNPLSTKKGIKISDSVHFTPASVRAKQE